MAGSLWILKLNRSNVSDFVEHGTVSVEPHERERMQPGQLVLAKFIKGLGKQLGNRVVLYRIKDLSDASAQLEPLDHFNDQVKLTVDDWERLRFVPMGLRAMHVWQWDHTENDRGLSEIVEGGPVTREQLLDRCFVITASSIAEAEKQARQWPDIRPFDRFVCATTDGGRLKAHVLEAGHDGNLGDMEETAFSVEDMWDVDISDIKRAAARSERIARYWEFIAGAGSTAEVPYDSISFYRLLCFPKLVANVDYLTPWESPMWQGLMAWVQDEQYVERRRLVAEQARLRITELLSEEHLDELTLDEFNQSVWRFGAIRDGDGNAITEEQYLDYPVETIRQRLASGDWSVEGNQMVGQTTNAYGVNLETTDDELRELLPEALRTLLCSDQDLFVAAARVIKSRNGLGPNAVTMMLAMLFPDRMGLYNAAAISGMKRLSWLLSAEDEWKQVAADYRRFNDFMQELLEQSGGVLRDMLMVDAFLYRLTRLPEEPRYWKVALALGPEHAHDADELYGRAISEDFAALKGGDPDPNDAAFREIQPGDYVVMHREACIGGVGRVTRPYYEISAADADEIDSKWYRRIGVQWLAGERDYGDALPGAKQRRTVIDLASSTFWSLAARYADDPRYEEVLGRTPTAVGQPSAWIFQCNPERWDLLAALQKPVPFREDWAANQQADRMRIGDTVYLWKSGEDAGIYGIAHIISEVYETPGDEFGERKVDLLVEWPLTDRPLLRDALREDDRTSPMRIVTSPQGTNFRLSAEEDDAIRKMLDMPEECYYSLAAKWGGHFWQDAGLAYIYGVGAAGKPKQLTEDIQAGKAINYLLYHTGNDTSYYGSFGRVLEIYPSEGAHDEQRGVLMLEVIGFEPPLSLTDGSAQEWRQKTEFFASDNPINLRVVFPLSTSDYYTAVGAGFSARPVAADFRNALRQHLPKAVCDNEAAGWYKVSGPSGKVRVKTYTQAQVLDDEQWHWAVDDSEVGEADFVAFFAPAAGLGGLDCWLIVSAQELGALLPKLPDAAPGQRELRISAQNTALMLRQDGNELDTDVTHWRNDFPQIGRAVGLPQPFVEREASFSGPTQAGPFPPPPPPPPPPPAELARACCCSVQFVEDVLAQLRRKGEVIFFGPPGTGKTFVARKLAEYLARGDDSRRELIQFHPSYTYEDFMEGIKPESRQCGEDRWEVSYPVRAGSFKRFCERATDDPDRDYVFVIDEINRGQIAKIFGELMYLLEYRDDQIELAYTKSEGDDRERFGIPPNVLIIGTMNTADRSIALVDFALRRRFTFIPFYPDEGDVRGMLPMWLDGHASHMDWVGRMLDIVNKRLTEAMGRDYLIGHSYFMCDGLSEGLVREVWRYQIEPLLHEYFVGTPERVRTEFGLEALIRQAKGLPDDDADEEAASE